MTKRKVAKSQRIKVFSSKIVVFKLIRDKSLPFLREYPENNMELENILTEEMNPVLQELISWSVKRPHTQVHDWPLGLILDTPVKCEHKTKFSDIVSFLLHCSRSRTRKGIKALVLFFPPPQGSVAKGERTYFVKRLCENTEEKRPTHSHTQPETHTLHKPTLKNVDKLFFFRSADQLQLS